MYFATLMSGFSVHFEHEVQVVINLIFHKGITVLHTGQLTLNLTGRSFTIGKSYMEISM